MAKFLKSIFAPDKRKNSQFEGDAGEHDFTPPLDGRRKLSISRSGRMKQANKKRHSLSMDLYGEENLQTVEKPKSVEYHVNNPVTEPKNQRRRSAEPKASEQISEPNNKDVGRTQRSSSEEIKTPEQEIESAFEIIDKIS